MKNSLRMQEWYNFRKFRKCSVQIYFDEVVQIFAEKVMKELALKK